MTSSSLFFPMLDTLSVETTSIFELWDVSFLPPKYNALMSCCPYSRTFPELSPWMSFICFPKFCLSINLLSFPHKWHLTFDVFDLLATYFLSLIIWKFIPNFTPYTCFLAKYYNRRQKFTTFISDRKENNSIQFWSQYGHICMRILRGHSDQQRKVDLLSWTLTISIDKFKRDFPSIHLR